MAYEILPNSGDTLGGTRDQIRQNFSLIQSTIDKNHVDLSGNDGRHKWVEIPDVNSTTTEAAMLASLSASEGTLYTKSGSSTYQLFYTNENTGNIYQLTRCIDASFSTFGKNNLDYFPGMPAGLTKDGGWTFLPGNGTSGCLIYQYGKVTTTTTLSTVLFPLVFPSGTAPFSITLTAITNSSSGAAIRVLNGTATSAQFEYASDSAITGFYWFAIGN